MQLLINKIQCNHCGEILISQTQHDFKMCSCGKCGNDGGKYYARFIGEPKNYINLCVYDNGNHDLRRETLMWGKNMNKDGNILGKTEWITIKDMDSDHIWAILTNVNRINLVYRQTFEDELLFRMGEKIRL